MTDSLGVWRCLEVKYGRRNSKGDERERKTKVSKSNKSIRKEDQGRKEKKNKKMKWQMRE